MRTFLEDERTFSWPDDERRKGSYYQFDVNTSLDSLFEVPKEDPLSSPKWRAGNQSVQKVMKFYVRVEKQGLLQFDQPLAVKQLSRVTSSPEAANSEGNAMRGLRHPHVVALLGVFWHGMNDHIAMFPAGRCDLGDFLTCISKKIKAGDTVAVTPDRRHMGNDEPREPKYAWPFNLPLRRQLDFIQKYFLCLCRALEYLHESQIRHKDIKLENVIIDDSGQVVFVDFGISKHWENATEERTQEMHGACTRRNAPPELAEGEVRDRRSDVWSLGCVFLDMVSVLFGRSHEDCQKHCRQQNPMTKAYDSAIYANSSKAQDWLTILDKIPFRNPAFEDKVKTETLPTIRKMLDLELEERPYANKLSGSFDITAVKCDDCHPTAGTWKKSPMQKKAYSETQHQRENLTEAQNLQEEEVLAEIASTKAELPSSHPAPELGTETRRPSTQLSPPNRTRSPELPRDKRRSVHFSEENLNNPITPIHVHPPPEDVDHASSPSSTIPPPPEPVGQRPETIRETSDESLDSAPLPPPSQISKNPAKPSKSDERPKSQGSPKALEKPNGLIPPKAIVSQQNTTGSAKAASNNPRLKREPTNEHNGKRCLSFNVQHQKLKTSLCTIEEAKGKSPSAL